MNDIMKIKKLEKDLDSIKKGAREIYHLLPRKYKEIVLDEFKNKIGVK